MEAWFIRMLALPLTLLCALGAAGSAAAAGARGTLPPPFDLHADGTKAAVRGTPIVFLFSLPGCAFCDVVRQNYLAPLLRDLPEAQQPIIREVQINGNGTFIGFNREHASHQALARSYGARFAPTVVMVDGKGNILTAPIVGGDTAGLYGGYLDNAFGEAARKLKNSNNMK